MERKVFIVDDDPIMGSLLQSQLAEAGFEAQYFTNGEDALEKIFQIRSASWSDMVVIADVIMPEVDGCELRRRLRGNPETAGLPFVFLSTKDEPLAALEELRTGADDYVCKPFKMENLLERMEAVMARAAKAVSFRSEADFGGDLAQTNLDEIVQIAELNCKSGELVLRDPEGNMIGSAYFSKGRLKAAQTGRLEGSEAFYELMGEARGTFEFSGKERDVPDQITAENSAILARAGRMLNQSKKFFAKVGDQNALLNIRSREMSAAIEDQIGKDRLEKILSMIHARKTVGDILNGDKMSRLGTASALMALLDAGITEISGTGSRVSEATSQKHVPNVIDEKLTTLLKDAQDNSSTGILEKKNHQTRAAIFFQKGVIVHAYHERTMGKKALYRIFSEKGGTFTLVSQPVAVHQTIHDGLSHLLEEGDKEAETMRRLNPESFETLVSMTPRALEKSDDVGDRPGLIYVLSLVQQYGRVREIMDASQMTDLQTYKHLLYMVQKEILRVEEEKKTEVRLVTDSNAELPSDIALHQHVTVVPLSVTIGTQRYRDGIDLSPEAFYRTMRGSDHMPEVSPPSEDEFHQAFQNIVSDADIVAIIGSGKAFEHAEAARQKNDDEYSSQRQYRGGKALQLEIIDSQSASLGMGLLVTEAADKIRQGASAKEVHAYIRQLIPMIRIFFMADTPTYLHKDRQVGKAKSIWGRLLRTKPILVMQNGELTPIDHIRGAENAQELILELIQQSLPHPDTSVKVGVMHADAPDQATRMRRLLESRLNCQNIIMSHIGPMVGSHCGPGTVAVAFFPWPDHG